MKKNNDAAETAAFPVKRESYQQPIAVRQKKAEGKKRKSPCTPFREKAKGKETQTGFLKETVFRAGALGGGLVAVSSGCSSMTPSSKTQSMGVYALGIPGIAIITNSTQKEDASGGDTNMPTQTNPVTTTITTGK